MKTFKKIIKIAATTLLSVIAAILVFFCAVVPLRNNIVCARYARELKKYDLGVQYEVIADDRACGKLTGNGNGMQFYAAYLIYCEEPLAVENTDWEGVFLQPASEYQSWPDSYHDKIQSALDEFSETDNYYILYSFYSEPFDTVWNSDIRGH